MRFGDVPGSLRQILDDINHDDLVGGDGGGGVGPWRPLTLISGGWTDSTLRSRTVPGGLQFEGIARYSQPAGGIVELGYLPAPFPQRQQVMMMAVTGGAGYGYGFLVFQTTGQILAWYGIDGTQIYPSGIVALD